jgi:pimeloyl-ACP methyl ester carboxylesterase
MDRANLYLPDHSAPTSPVIVFLHGYGGSFLWYQHWLSEAFPDAIIICPAYGVSPAMISQEYVSEAITAASAKIGFGIKKPTLIGLSAGGFGACRAYTASPSFYSRLICLASYPPEESIARFAKDAAVDFVAGAEEPFAKSGQLAKSAAVIRQRGAASRVHLVPGGDHFFMLSQREASMRVLRTVCADSSTPGGH